MRCMQPDVLPDDAGMGDVPHSIANAALLLEPFWVVACGDGELGDSDFLRCIGAAAEAEDGRLHPTVAGLLMFGHDWRIAEELPNYFLDYRQQTSFDERWQDRVVSQGGD
ncbi:MAG: hypothetical protein ACFNZW_04190, partial [Coriobacteriaceae bacterium]